MLGADQFDRIEAGWRPTRWPEGTDPYAGSGYRRPFSHYAERVRHLGLSGELLIDAGCGGGHWSFAWATRFEGVLGVDVTARRLATAIWQKQRLDVPAVEFVIGDQRKIPAADMRADAVFFNNLRLRGDPLEPILRDAFRVLKPGGVCYLGLTAASLAFARARGPDARLAQLGRGRIYNTLCRRHLSTLIAAISPGAVRNAAATASLSRGLSPADLLISLDCESDQIVVADVIARDLGEVFSQILLADLAAIAAGTKAAFGERAWGEDWDPDEISAIARDSGFGRSEWAPQGWLSLQPDGSVGKSPGAGGGSDVRPVEGRSRAFEMLLWKPLGKVAAAVPHADLVVVKAAGLKGAGQNLNHRWRLQAGTTTFWNADPAEINLPIIDLKPPLVTELRGAIITPRDITPMTGASKRGQKRYIQGGIYDSDLHLLPEFLERESFETLRDIGNQLKNEPIFPVGRRADAQKLLGSYIYLGVLRRHFGHFLLESLCRMWYLLESDEKLKVIFHGFDRFDKLPSYVLHIFRLLDFDLDRIVVANGILSVEHLLLPQSEFEIRWKARTSYANLFKELYERNKKFATHKSRPNRIYLTRRQLKIKKEKDRIKQAINEHEVETVFSARGFEVVAPEKLPFAEQIAVVGGAGQIAGLKGSALHMSLFSQRPKARLIQIGQHQTTNQCLVDGVKNMEAHHIFCQSPPRASGSMVDIEILRAALREM